MQSAEFKRWTNLRQSRRGQVTQIFNQKDTFDSLTHIEKRLKIDKLVELKLELESLNESIQTTTYTEKEDESLLNADIKKSDEYFDRIRECIALLKESDQSSSTDVARSLLKSPTAPLPTFRSEDGEDLLKFIRCFDETVKRFSYTEYEKLLLLKQQVSGSALKLLNSLEITKQSYTHAVELLKEAFASPSVQKFTTIRQISQMKLGYDGDPYEYISKMRNLTEAVNSLNIESETFLQYFFWKGLNDTFQTQIIHITNENKPSLKKITDSFFEATERYTQLTKNYKNKQRIMTKNNKNLSYRYKETTGLAASVKSNPRFQCCLCSQDSSKDSNHSIRWCQNYRTPQEKIERLKQLNGCVKCGMLSHITTKCRFSFNRRCSCKQWHFEFLCCESKGERKQDEKRMQEVKDNKENKKEKPKDKANELQTVTKVATVVDAFPSVFDSDSILPTFTAYVNERPIRALKDLGCQCNFIKENLVDNLDIPVICKDVALKINGFNSNKDYNTKIVAVELTIGEKKFLVEAICIPEIKISMTVPDLEHIAKEFHNKGYKLADPNLINCRDEVSNLDFILGTKAAYCLKHNEVSFGPGQDSLYADTDLGVMLMGDTKTLRKNLQFLPNVKDKPIEAFTASITSRLLFLSENQKDEQVIEGIANDKEEDCVKTSVNTILIDPDGHINESELMKATYQMLEEESKFFTQYEENETQDSPHEINQKLIEYTLSSTYQNEEGRLVMPLMWNSKVAHLLGSNKELAVAVLKSNLNKLRKKPDYLKLMDESFKDQEKLGIIERIDNLDQFLEEHPEHSFMPHMGVFKLDRATSKCRVVYLSNLCQKDSKKPMTVSHNQAIFSGPNLNQKISSSMLQLRFDKKILIYDLQKAFNQISLREEDANRLLCLWFKNVEKEDFSLVGYRNVRLSFGLRCSPALLMLGLFKILVLDAQYDSQKLKQVKSLLYQCMYMDNGAITVNSKEELDTVYRILPSIFQPYHFHVQQLVTNEESLQNQINDDFDVTLPTPEVVKLLGASWNRKKDTLTTKPISLDAKANTKRKVLGTIASQYDIYNFNGPIMNRSRIFLHKLQCDRTLGWDDTLPTSLQREWRNISRQANASPTIEVQRSMGNRNDSYKLLACTDASKTIYGIVVYIQNQRTNQTSFVCAKNRIVNAQLDSRTVPALELQAIALGAQCLTDIFNDLCGSFCLHPINIEELVICSDSLVALSWINSSNKLVKMQKYSVFVQNRINQINKYCEVHPIRFAFVNGCDNPADFITRPVSYKQLSKSNYLTGPILENSKSRSTEFMSFVVPNQFYNPGDPVPHDGLEINIACAVQGEKAERLVQQDSSSSFRHLVRVHARIFEFVHKLKWKVRTRNPNRFLNIEENPNFYQLASRYIFSVEQRICYPEIFKYFNLQNPKIKDIPNLIRQINVYKDKFGLLRVGSKFTRFDKKLKTSYFPILLPKDNWLTNLIIMNMHEMYLHSGSYALLNELRKRFYVPCYFSNVKKVLKTCVSCRRFNERSIKINQSSYREVRVHPCEVPFANCYLDYMGPFYVKHKTIKSKIWILVITCMWSRAVNMKICVDMSTKEFIRAIQLHTFEFGLPQFCVSDLGSQIVAGANTITTLISDPETQLYFQENNIQPLKFDHFYKGHSQLGSLVEICVKMTKKLIYGAIKTNVLDLRDFEFIIAQTIHVVNRRPIAFKDSLRSNNIEDVPETITPEKLIKGFDLSSINVIPNLQDNPMDDPTWLNCNHTQGIVDQYEKLKKVRKNLKQLYETEFIQTLIKQAINEKDRYVPCTHKNLNVGDIVLIKEENTKIQHYPMGIVKEILVNDNGEVTGATILKGRTKEITKRHSSKLIPLLSNKNVPSKDNSSNHRVLSKVNKVVEDGSISIHQNKWVASKPKRKAAQRSRKNWKKLMKKDLI